MSELKEQIAATEDMSLKLNPHEIYVLTTLIGSTIDEIQQYGDEIDMESKMFLAQLIMIAQKLKATIAGANPELVFGDCDGEC